MKVSFALKEWMRTNEIEESTSNTRGSINRAISPALGKQPVNKISARMLETWFRTSAEAPYLPNSYRCELLSDSRTLAHSPLDDALPR